MIKNIKVHLDAFGDKRENVFAFDADHGDDKESCEYVFHFSNAPELMLDELQTRFASKWRALGLRSLSVGDIVQVNDRKYRCESFGWKEL